MNKNSDNSLVPNDSNKDPEDLAALLIQLLKMLPFLSIMITGITYIMFLSYTSTYSIPFPYTFFPYLIMFGVVIACTAAAISFVVFLPLLLLLWSFIFLPDKNYYQKFLTLCANGGLVRWHRLPETARQFLNLFTPAIAFKISLIFYVSLGNLGENVWFFFFAVSFIILILNFIQFLRYLYCHNDSATQTTEEKHSIFISFLFAALILYNFFYIVWYTFLILIIAKIPQIRSYEGGYEWLLLFVTLFIPLVATFFMFGLAVRGNRRGIFAMPVIITLFLLVIFPGGTTFMTNALSTHNLGGGVIATLFMKKNACQHLNDLVEEPAETAPEEVCTTRPVAVLLNIGDTIYVGEVPGAAAMEEPDGKNLAGVENNNQTPDGAEKVWSVDRSTVIGMEFQSRGKSRWLALPDPRS